MLKSCNVHVVCCSTTEDPTSSALTSPVTSRPEFIVPVKIFFKQPKNICVTLKNLHLAGCAAGVAGGGGRGGGGGLLQVPQKVGGVQGHTNVILTQHFI